MKLEFKDEMIIPKINGEIYYSVYELENWLRRICHSIYMIEFGESWLEHIPKNVYEGYNQRKTKNDELSYFDADSEDNLIWSLTHFELEKVLLNPEVWNRIQVIFGFSTERFKLKLSELREIRNLLAHNRALSERTARIVEGVIESLHLAVDKFKFNYLYNSDTEIILPVPSEDKVNNFFANKMSEHNHSEFQAIMSKDKDLYSIICLPVHNDRKYLSAYKLLENYQKVLNYIVAIQINKEADEYIVTFSNKISFDNIKLIIDRFTQRNNVWTKKKYEEQHPKYICNPRVWFYENRRPIEE